MKANPSGCSQFGEPLQSCVVYAFTFVDHCHEKHFHQTIENLYLFLLRLENDVQKAKTPSSRLYHSTFFMGVFCLSLYHDISKFQENPTVRSSNMFKIPTQSLIPQKTGQPCYEHQNPICLELRSKHFLHKSCSLSSHL
ncbi:hypothetical protein D8674_013240 [Pyrus ussuriensis x Pyrus communis]|uniref:Uncharacterized protein n=1 Tax=Pyrus ussuriensis x Pyrus communis TaxID=2448454 RepID=A0A5N5GTZ6_9ROSA|nr:hypothetical protein D8674_013240 [Pyrus ussuriensis x Pyrus communis]